MIRRARMNDLDDIMIIIKSIKEEMITSNNCGWTGNFPSLNDFLDDIRFKNLYVYEGKENEVSGLICINFIEPSIYRDLSWSLDERAIILHRLAIDRNSRNQGMATALMKFAEKMAIDNNIYYIRTDTYSKNTITNALLEKLEYRFVGKTSLGDISNSHYCYDKQLV